MLVAWSEGYGVLSNPVLRHGVVVGGALAADGGSNTLRAGSNQTRVALAYGAGKFLLVWEDDRSQRKQLWARRFAADGQAIGTAFEVSPSATEQEHPAVSFDGANFLLRRGLKARRLSA